MKNFISCEVHPPNDLSGKKINMLTVVTPRGKEFGGVVYECKRDCGNFFLARGSSILSGKVKSCGCYHKKILKKQNKKCTKHGKHLSPEYRVWADIKKRCLNPNNSGFSCYGGRGIRICDEWINSFETFFKDMGYRPSSKHQIDRLDNNGDYSKKNCKWVLPKENARNRRTNRFIKYKGENKTLAQWAEVSKIHYCTLSARLRNGWDVERAINTPVQKRTVRENESPKTP